MRSIAQLLRPAGCWVLGFVALATVASGQELWVKPREKVVPTGFTVARFGTASMIQTEGGDQQSGGTGSELADPLTVLVTDSNGDPVTGAKVVWKVIEGSAQLLDGRETRTNTEGLTSNRVRLGMEPGPVVIEARVKGTDQRVLFTLTARLGLAELALDEAQEATARALEEICSQPDPGGMTATCEALAGMSDPERVQALEELSPKKVPAQGTDAVEAMTVQSVNLFSRLAALRRAKKRSLELLAFDVRGHRLPGEVLASNNSHDQRFDPDIGELIRKSRSGGAASADDQKTGSVVDEDDFYGRRVGFFMGGLVAIGERPTTERETGFDLQTGGITIGLDYKFTRNVVWGGAMGFMKTDSELEGSGGTLDAQGLSGFTYFLVYPDSGWFLEGYAGAGKSDFESARVIDFPGNPQVASAKPEGNQLSLGLGFGYDAQFGPTTFSLLARGSYINADINAYEEEGAPGMQLAIDDQEVESLLGTAGFELAYAGSTSWGVVMPILGIAYQHEFADDSRLITARFVDDPQGITFVIPTDDPDRDYFTAGGGLTLTFAHGTSAYALYEQDFGRDDLDVYVVTVGLRLELK